MLSYFSPRLMIILSSRFLSTKPVSPGATDNSFNSHILHYSCLKINNPPTNTHIYTIFPHTLIIVTKWTGTILCTCCISHILHTFNDEGWTWEQHLSGLFISITLAAVSLKISCFIFSAQHRNASRFSLFMSPPVQLNWARAKPYNNLLISII